MSVTRALTTTDSYQYVSCPDTTRITIQVSNASINIGFGSGFGPLGSARYDNDETLLPTQGSLGRTCDEIRVKSAVPGRAATVNLTALTDDG